MGTPRALPAGSGAETQPKWNLLRYIVSKYEMWWQKINYYYFFWE